MSSLSEAMKRLRFDKRLVDYNISQGTLSAEDLQKHIASLPDSGSNSEPINVEDDRADALDAH